MTIAEVFLWGTRIGYIGFDNEDGIGRFEYDARYIASGVEVSPIVMPLRPGQYRFPALSRETFHGLPGLLADSLPDKFGNAVINQWLESQNRNPESFNPVERLCYTGSRGMGALEFRPVTGPNPTASEIVSLDHLTQLANQILLSRQSLQANYKTDADALEQILLVGTSAGGARAKALIAWNETTGELRSGQISTGPEYGSWILKFDGVSANRDKEERDSPQYTRIEYAYSLMAQAAGITMSECRLLEHNGLAHFMTRRFDRDQKTGAKRHMQTLCGLAHLDFNLPGACSYEQAARILLRLSLPQSDIDQFYRRMVFNVLAQNNDDHTKNISFLMDRKGTWRLSPAYDVTYAYNPTGMWTGRHQMSVNGKRSAITRADLVRVAGKMGVRKKKAEEILEAVSQATADWEMYAQKAGLAEQTAEKIKNALVCL